MHTQVMGGDLKGATGTGRGLFENQGNVLTLKGVMGNTGLLLCLQLCGKVNESGDLFGGEVQKCEKMLSGQIHSILLFDPGLCPNNGAG